MNNPNTKKIQCVSCDGTIFAQAAELFFTSALVSPTGNPTVEMSPVFYCTKCNTVLDLASKVSPTDLNKDIING